MRIWTIALFLFAFMAKAVDTAPPVLRACIDFDNQTVTLTWKQVADACGSFTSYEIHSNLNAGPFTKIATIPNIATTEFVDALPDLDPDRCYFIRVKTLCDMLDSAQSNTVCVDQVFPSITLIDSVSVDVASQDVIVGWTANSTPDTKGYQILNFTGSIGDSIGYTTNTNFTASSSPSTKFPITIATNDSCNLYAPLSPAHTVAWLQTTIDTCLREISLSWTLYKGWSTIDSQAVMQSTNGGAFVKHKSIDGSTNSLTISGITLGDTFCYYIRSYTTVASLISSSSNIKCIETRKLEVPSFVYLDNVSVANNSYIETKWTLDNVKDQKEFVISRGVKDNPTTQLTTIATNPSDLTYTYSDLTPDVTTTAYDYQITCFNKCDEQTGLSQISNSMHFRVEPLTNHDSYKNWDGLVDRYEIEFQKPGSSTWNSIATYNQLTHLNFRDSSGCFRAVAYENSNQYGLSATSYSNESCLEPVLTYYVPNAINPNGNNNRFLVIGNGIDHSKSTFTIIDRWGEIIAKNSTDGTWDGTYKGEQVQNGIYIYILHIYGFQGQKESQKGIISVLK